MRAQELIPHITFCFVTVKADLDGTIFAYNHRMQPAHVILTTRVVPSRSIPQLTQVCCMRLEKVLAF